MVEHKKVAETKATARAVLVLLGEVDKQLKSARNWGAYDLLGGGFFSSMIKHNRINKAERLLQQVQAKLVELQRLLGDVSFEVDSSVNITSFERFTDIAFDNIISDWLVQSKIQNSRKSVTNLTAEIRRILEALEQLN